MRPFVSSLRKGFTLPEVLVTVAVVSVLAAAVVPAVVNQVAKGDLPALQADLNSVRGAVGNFTTDVKRYPGSMTQLTLPVSSPITATDNDIYGNDFGVGAANFHGPYLSSKATLSSSVLYKTASFGFAFKDSLTIQAGHIALRIVAASNSGEITHSDATALKLAIDGNGYSVTPSVTSGQVNGTTTCNSVNGNTGFVRIFGVGGSVVTGANGSGTGGSCTTPSGTVDSVKFLLVQIGG
jgi:prepilin-type N-terminal cleavage/methylation domain-containing protein